MKKKIFQVIAISAAATLVFSSCGQSGNAGNNNKVTDGDYGTWTFDPTLSTEYEPNDTDVVLAENGRTDYVVVVPQSSTWQVNQAKEELNLFFEQSTGVRLPVQTDEGLTFDSSKKYISIGDTTVYQGSGMRCTYEEYEEDGFAIKTIGSTVIIASAEANGMLYGVYDFLRYNLGVRIWSNDEFTVPKHDKVYVKAFDYKSVPDFDSRALGLSYEMYPYILEYRLGLSRNNGKNLMSWCHTSFQLLDPNKYQEEHADWYYPNYTGQAEKKKPQQLCYSNEGMKEELIKVLKEKVEASSLKYGSMLITQEDNSGFCNCDNCQAEINKYGYGGFLMRFINEIADVMNPWVEETFNGEKEVKWVIFAYGLTKTPPVVKNSNGTYLPVDESVVAHKNVGVMLAPLSADWAHSLVDGEHNAEWKSCFEGWQVIKPTFYAYTYNVVFDDQFIFMDSWSYVKQSYQLFEQIGVNFIFDQGASHCNLPFFELTSYVRSRILWDTNTDVEKEIDAFMNAYYKTAAPKVKEYFDLLRTRYKIIDMKMAENGEKFWLPSYVRYDSDLRSAEYWPKEWLLNGIRIYDEALELCSQIEDSEERAKAERRVKAERLSPVYLLMQIHRTSLSKAEITHYIDIFRDGCDVNSIEYYTEHGVEEHTTVKKLLDEWSVYLN